MPLDATCPQCALAFPVAEVFWPVGVECPGCGAGLTVEFRPVPHPAPGEPHYQLQVTPGLPPDPSVPADCRFPGRPIVSDELDPRRAKATSSGRGLVAAAALTALLVNVAGLGWLASYLFSPEGLDTSAADRRSSHLPPAPENRLAPRVPPPPPVALDLPGGDWPPFKLPTVPDLGSHALPSTVPVLPPPPVSGLPAAELPPPRPFFLRPVMPSLPPLGRARLDADGTREIVLPRPAGAVAVAAGGRYLVMHFPQTAELACLDVTSGEIVAQVVTEDTTGLLAAGATRAVFYAPQAHRLRVYSVPRLEKLEDARPALFSAACGLALGHQTDGPLLLVDARGEVVLQEVHKPGLPEVAGSRGKPGIRSGVVRASAHGRHFATADGFGPRDTVVVLTESAGRWQVSRFPAPTPFPTASGTLFLGRGGAADADGRLVPLGSKLAGSWLVPAVTGLHYLKITPGGGPAPRTLTVSVHFGRDPASADQPFVGTRVFESLPAEGLFDSAGEPVVPLDQRFILVPEARVLMTLPGSADRVVMRRFTNN